jgi:hypothetical protein
MNRKDIALTVAGVLATMALAYLFYRQQTAAAAPAVQDVTDPNYYTNQGLYDASMAYQYASQLPSLSLPTISSTSSTSALASQVDTSASTAATGNEPGTDITSLLSQIIADYHDQNAPAATADFSTLQIPTLDAPPSITTTGIPTTASDALTDAQNMLSNNTSFTASQNSAVPAPSTQAPSTSSAGPVAVHNNHILASASPGYYAA